jgi:hypothetical protein
VIDRLHDFRYGSFGGQTCAQYWVDFMLWECVLNEQHPYLQGIIELGTWEGGFSRYLYAQTVERDMRFVTYDIIQPQRPPPCFHRLDFYRYPTVVREAAYGMGAVALFCDGGNKPRELATFPELMPPGSIFLVHDWGTETLPEHVPDSLEMIYGPFCEEIGSITRVFKMKESA